MTEDLRYPIGLFQYQENINPDQLKEMIDRIRSTPERLAAAVEGMSEAQLDTPYRPGGWTVRQVIHHVPDSHLNSYIRFHWTLTEDTPLIKAYNEADWADMNYLKAVPIEVSLNLLKSVHARWTVLLDNLTPSDLERSYRHPEDGKTYSLQTAISLYAWHGDHHIAHITSLKERMGW